MPFAGGGTGAGGLGGSSALTCQAHTVRQAEAHALPPLLRLVGALHVLCLQCGRRHRRGGGQHGAAAVPARVCGAAPIPAALRPPANCPCSLLTSNTLNSWRPNEMACSWAPCAPQPLLSASRPASACAASGRAGGGCQRQRWAACRRPAPRRHCKLRRLPPPLTPVRRLAAPRTGSRGPCPEADRFKLAGMPAPAEQSWACLGKLGGLLEARVC